MFVVIRQPVYPLNQVVEQLVYYTDYRPDYSASYLLPEGKAQLLIPLDDGVRTFYTGANFDHVVTGQYAIVCGMQKVPVLAKADYGATMVAVKFKGAGGFPLLQLPLVEMNGLYVEADAIFGRSILLLREQLLELADPDAILHRLERFLLERLHSQGKQQELMTFALARLTDGSKTAAVDQIAAEVGYSHKQFIHLFKKHVGLTPKLYQRVSRFNHALVHIHTAASPDWFEVSQTAGYYDQAHFINEFRHFSTVTPAQYLELREQYPNFVPVYESESE